MNRSAYSFAAAISVFVVSIGGCYMFTDDTLIKESVMEIRSITPSAGTDLSLGSPVLITCEYDLGYFDADSTYLIGVLVKGRNEDLPLASATLTSPSGTIGFQFLFYSTDSSVYPHRLFVQAARKTDSGSFIPYAKSAEVTYY